MIKAELGRLIYKSAGKLISNHREIAFARIIAAQPNGIYQVNPVPPYISQLADADPAKIIGFYQRINDSTAAKKFGAKSLDDFSYWAWRSCGIVGVQMVLRTQLGSDFNKTTAELIMESDTLGGYEKKQDRGWKHKALIDLARKYGINGWLEKFVPPSQIAHHILNNEYVLTSIISESGGHLILVYGFRLENGKVKNFLVQDPNNFKEKGEAKEIPLSRFNQLSTRRVLVFESKGERNDSN